MGDSSQSKERDGSLDVEFRRILRQIKQYIPFINSNYYLSQYRVWIEKLSSEHSDKSLRNSYLSELARQIQEKILAPPFDGSPPDGSINNLVPIEEFIRYSEEEIAVSNKMEEEELTWPFNENPYFNQFKSSETLKTPTKNEEEPNNFYQLFQQKESTKSDKNTGEQQLKGVFDNKEADPSTKPVTASRQIENISEELDENSWSDVTDVASGMALGAGDTETNKCDSLDNENNIETIKEEEIDPTYDSVIQAAKIKLSEIRVALKDTNFISSDWKKMMEAMQVRLTETVKQNNELKEIISSLHLEIKEGASRNSTLEAKINACENSRVKEIEALKQMQEDNAKNLEKSFQVKLEEAERIFNKRDQEVRRTYEMEITRLKSMKDAIVQEKNEEITRLTAIIQEQCKKIVNDISQLKSEISTCNNDNKIAVLQKCIAKMDKLFHKSEKNHLKQIEKLKQELDLKERAMQIQLSTQRADIVVRTVANKKEEIDDIINGLEVKYIKMLEQHENEMMEMKERDNKKIQALRQLLDANAIEYSID